MAPLTPDRSYHIGAAARLRLKPGVDPGALERLLQYFPAESRASHLDMFSVQELMDSDGRVPDVTVLDRISDPIMQHLLEEVWQPYWATVNDADLEQRGGGPPGRKLARRRRARQHGD